MIEAIIISWISTLIIAKMQGRNMFIHFGINLFLPIIWPLGLLFYRKTRKGIKCTWCGSRKLNFLQGAEGDWHWQFRNNDGSQDKRANDNYQQASYKSLWQCKKCDGTSEFTHYVTQNPSKDVEAWKGHLVEEGKGKRKAKDFVNNKGTVVYDRESANRKGK